MNIVFIGGGNMAHALIGGLVQRGIAAREITAIDPNSTTRQHLANTFGIQTAVEPSASIQHCDVIVLAVKPQVLQEVAATLAPFLTSSNSAQLIISIAAGIRTTDIARWLGGTPHIVRAMPNTPALIGQGITGLFARPEVSKAERARATEILAAAGQVIWFDSEDKIDAVTAISGSGPAYVLYFIEALQQAAQELGLTAEQSRTLAVSTFTGAAQLAAQSKDSLATLRERVTSKGGTTAAALTSFDNDQIQSAIQRGARAAYRRAIEMSEAFGQR